MSYRYRQVSGQLYGRSTLTIRDSLNCIEFSGDNTLVAVGTSESFIRVWSLENKPLISPTDPSDHQPSSSRRLIGHSGPVYALSFSPSIALPLTSTPQNATTNGDTTSTHHNKPITGAPRYLLSSSADTSIRLWDLSAYTNLVVYRSHSAPVWDVRFSPHGHYFATCSADRTARLWTTSHIAPHRLLVGHDADVDCLAWHPNSAYLFTAACSPDRSVRMWDIQRGSAVRLFTGHAGNVTALAASRDGRLLASADDRGDILLWDLAAGRLVKRMRGHARGAGVWSLDWSVESSVLVSAGADGTVRVWDVRPPSTSGAAVSAGADGKVIGEGGAGTKIDGAGVAVSSGAGSTGANGAANAAGASASTGAAASTATNGVNGAKKALSKDVVVSPDQISAFPTKKSPVYKVRFTQMNLVVAGGAYLP